MSSNNFLIIFFTYIKILKIYQLDIIKIIKKDFKNQLVKDIKIFLKKIKKKSNSIVVNNKYKNLPEDEKQKLLEYRKKYKIRKNILL